jgi:RHS repeat-associated protein
MIRRIALFVLLSVLSVRIVDASSIGRTPGKFGVSPMGSGQYSIPIWAPPGPRGMQPNLSLLYDSHSSIGPLGIGWSLAGLGQITRCNLTAAQDAAPAAVALVIGDGYCINGKRLRLTSASGTYGAAGSTYQTEIADFSQITANGNTTNGGVNTGPASFTVQGRNGLTYYYGYTDSNGNGVNSQVLANGTTTALTWLLSKVVDRAGNNYVINYLAPSTALSGTSVPDKILWTPATAGSSSYTSTMQFNYGTNAPQSSIFAYVSGTQVSNTELLTSIEIFVGTTVVKDYFLGYQVSPLTGREELISVTECADSAGSNCLLPTTVGYQTGSPGVSTALNTVPSSAGAVAARYDFNGDGYPDLVFNNGGSWFVAFGSASGYGTPFNTGISVGPGPALFGNVTGGPQDGILQVVGSTWTYYVWNGSSFTGTSITGFTYDASSKNYILADINGDGLPDLFSQKDTTTIVGGHSILTSVVSYHLNTSSSTTASFNANLATAYSTGGGGILSVFLQGPDAQNGKLRRYDFNGDGRDDLIVQIESGTAPNLTLKTYELISTGTAFTISAPISTIAASTTFIPIFFTNWNDDKCTDFVTSNTLYISGCNGSAPQTYPLPGTILLGMDWDGDGRTDILVQNGTTIGVYLSPGTSTVAPSITPTSVPYSASCTYVWMDANADGLDDLGCFSSTAASYYLHNGTSDLATSFVDGYGNSVFPTYGPISESNYTKYSDAVFPYQDYIGPLYVVKDAVFSDPSNMPGGTYYQQFLYFGAWTNLQGRGFQSFYATNAYDSRNGLYDLQYYGRSFPYTGMKYQDIVTNGTFYQSESVGTTALTTLDGTANNERYFPYLSNVTTYQFEVGGSENSDLITTTSTNYTYDNYGNATNVVNTVTDNDPGSPYNGYTWTTNVTNTTDISANQSADLGAWCLNMLDETQVVYSSTLAGSTSVTRTKTFTPDSPTNCRINQVVTEPGGLYTVTENLVYDNSGGGTAFGNLISDTVSGANMPSSPASRLTTFNWGTTGQFLNSVTDPSGAITTANYTSNQSLTFGGPDSITNPNGLTTSWIYDAFGRKNKEMRPDGTSTTWTWSACTSFCGWSNSLYQIAQTAYQTNGSTVIRTDTNFYDPIDRVTQTAGPTVTGATATVQTLYNSLGLLAQRSMPFLSGTPYLQTYGYDALNRITSVTRPISSTNSNPQSTTYAYAGRKLTVSDPYGHTKTTIKDVNGWLRQTTDAIGYKITRAFDSAGSVIGVTDSVGNTLLSGVSYAYGLKPFLLGATDADRGAWIYRVDSLGERAGWTDANGNSFTMTYDALSRPSTRSEPDLFTQWTYGSTPANHDVGQMISECTGTTGTPPSSCGTTPIYLETRSFDSIGRLSTRAISESANPGHDPGGVYLFTTAYSATTGLPSTLTYPISTSSVALNLQYGYQNGVLQSVTDTTDTTTTCGTSCTLWTANAMNSFGEITQATLGNGVVINRTYDPVTSWLSAATAGVSGGSALLNQSYAQDENGNIIQRQNNNAPGLTENFFYDADNRITCATLSSSCSSPTIIYDAGSAGPGNITTQSGVGTYTYPATGQPRPHAVTSIAGTFNGIVNPVFAYDANGNMTNRASASANIAWTSFNYPMSISATDATGSETVAINYGPDRQRVQQNYTGPSGVETTFYIGGLMDIVVAGTSTDNRHYIYAGNEPIAVYSRTAAGANTMSYMLGDHQGSVSTIASNAGTADVNESFSAFGNRRDPGTWSGPPSTADLNKIASLSRQGYTFQTSLGQSMGLNHMNGRVEDAILGRFLSPDPIIQDPSNAQNYNRYTYVNNNPMSYTDPSGFCGQSSHPEVRAAVEFGCGGGGVTVPMGSVEGLSGTPDDGFGNLDNVGTDTQLQPIVPSVTTRLNPDGTPQASGQAPSAQGQTAQRPDSTTAPSPDTSAQNNGQIDGAILPAASKGQPGSVALIVNLAPGSNTLQVSVQNIDPDMPVFPSKVSVDVTLTIVNSSGTKTYSGPLTQSGESALYLYPGQSYGQSTPGFTGPGTAAVTFINYSSILLGVGFAVIYPTPQGAGH